MIPNPTGDPWLKKIGPRASWRATRLMEVFQKMLEDRIDEGAVPRDSEIDVILEHCNKISRLFRPSQDNNQQHRRDVLNIHAREAVHDAIDHTTEYLLNLTQADLLSVLVSHITLVVEELADPNSPLNTIILANKEEALLRAYFYTILPRVQRWRSAMGDDQSGRPMLKRSLIWISLIFRMICWFLLHDFNKEDVMIVPPDLKDSRMPVYIG